MHAHEFWLAYQSSGLSCLPATQATSLQTVADLKIEIQNKEQIPLQEQLLVFNAQLRS